jgi:colanic acid/amylovoran biosynthesis glycosyltransferase
MSRPLRIAFFTGTFPVISETFILRQITGLLDLGHEVHIYADAQSPSESVHPEFEKYRLGERTTYMDMPPETAPWEMPIWPITGRTWPPGSTTSVHNFTRLARALPKLLRCLLTSPALTCQVLKPSEYRYQAASLSALYRLAKLGLERRNYDVLHAHFGPVGNSFRFAKTLWHAPLVVSFHGYDFCTAPRQQGRDMYEKLFQTADVVTVNSEFTHGQVAKLGCPEVKLHRLPVGLNLDDFSFRERILKTGEPLRILTVGRLVEIKGHEFAVRAVGKLRERHPNVHYDIVGDGALRSHLEKLIAQLALQQIVTLHGALVSTEIASLMANAHAFVLASTSVEGDQEGQGLVLQEAQACGLPVVATRHGAFAEGIINNKSGFLVPERDVEALVERLCFLIEHPEIWPAMGRDGRAFVEAHYDIQQLNQQLVAIYTNAIKRSPERIPRGEN